MSRTIILLEMKVCLDFICYVIVATISVCEINVDINVVINVPIINCMMSLKFYQL